MVLNSILKNTSFNSKMQLYGTRPKNPLMASSCFLSTLGYKTLRGILKTEILPIVCMFLARIEQKAGPTGIEPAAYGFLRPLRDLRVRRSGLTELRAQRLLFGKEVSLDNIEVTVLLFQLDAVNTNN